MDHLQILRSFIPQTDYKNELKNETASKDKKGTYIYKKDKYAIDIKEIEIHQLNDLHDLANKKLQKYEQAKLPGSPRELPLRQLLEMRRNSLNVLKAP